MAVKKPDMLARLRAKFVAATMAMIALVIIAAFACICALDRSQGIAEVNAALTASLDAAAGNPATGGGQGQDPAPAVEPPYAAQGDAAGEAGGGGQQQPQGDAGQDLSGDSAQSSTSESEPAPPRIGGGGGQTIPVAVYAIAGGEQAAIASPFGTAAIDDSVLDAAVSRLADAADGQGELSDLGLFYEKRTVDDTAYLAFADADSAAGWLSLIPTLLMVGAGALGVFFAASVLFSRWALRPVERTWAQQRQFVADASHELKTPITVMLADASIALAHPGETVESQRQWIEGIQAEGQRMRGLVDGMLALAKLDAEEAGAGAKREIAGAGEATDLTDVARRAVLQFEAVAFERGVTLDDDIAEGVRAAAPRADLERLAGTLLDNACKYAAEGGRVHVALFAEGRRGVLRVENDGQAIDAADLPHVFDRFWRADKARTGDEDGAGGYGLGLSIARGIVRACGGELSAESSPERGTAFIARIPLAKPSENS